MLYIISQKEMNESKAIEEGLGDEDPNEKLRIQIMDAQKELHYETLEELDQQNSRLTEIENLILSMKKQNLEGHST